MIDLEISDYLLRAAIPHGKKKGRVAYSVYPQLRYPFYGDDAVIGAGHHLLLRPGYP